MHPACGVRTMNATQHVFHDIPHLVMDLSDYFGGAVLSCECSPASKAGVSLLLCFKFFSDMERYLRPAYSNLPPLALNDQPSQS